MVTPFTRTDVLFRNQMETKKMRQNSSIWRCWKSRAVRFASHLSFLEPRSCMLAAVPQHIAVLAPVLHCSTFLYAHLHGFLNHSLYLSWHYWFFLVSSKRNRHQRWHGTESLGNGLHKAIHQSTIEPWEIQPMKRAIFGGYICIYIYVYIYICIYNYTHSIQFSWLGCCCRWLHLFH